MEATTGFPAARLEWAYEQWCMWAQAQVKDGKELVDSRKDTIFYADNWSVC